MGYKLTSNWQYRDLVCLADLPEKDQKEFDYIDDSEKYSLHFVHYRGAWYDVNDSQRIEVERRDTDRLGWSHYVHPGEPLAHFDAIITDSYFSGVVFKLSDDGESVIVGRIYC